MPEGRELAMALGIAVVLAALGLVATSFAANRVSTSERERNTVLIGVGLLAVILICAVALIALAVLTPSGP